MPENRTNLFCQLDPQKECPPDCKLYLKTAEVLSRDVASGATIPELVARVRNQPLVLSRQYRRVGSEMLSSTGTIQQCNNYPQADIRMKP